MGVEVVVGGATDRELQAIARLFEGWDRVFSRFDAGSEVNRVNDDPAPVFVVSKLFASAVRTALGAAAATGGLVDPTLGSALTAAGYDRDFSLLDDRDERPPAPTAPERWRALSLHGRLLSRPPGLELDLNGVVKAMAVDASLELIRGDGLVAAGVTSAPAAGQSSAFPAEARSACAPVGSPPAGRRSGAGSAAGPGSIISSTPGPVVRPSRAGRR
jgi:thiamine biosynthesis lipoprotein